MYKIFCDICEKDITDYATNRMTGTDGRLKIEIIVAIDGVWNGGGHACEDCIRAACANAKIKRKSAPNNPMQATGLPLDDTSVQSLSSDSSGDAASNKPPRA